MGLQPFEPVPGPVHIPRGQVETALADARSITPVRVSRPVVLAVSHGSPGTARLRLERLARVVMTADRSIIDPNDVWSADWITMSVQGYEALDRTIRSAWTSVSTRNAMRDAVRAIIREEINAGMISGDAARPMMHALRIEKRTRDPEKQARGHLPPSRVAEIFTGMADDPSTTARRDAALIALLVGAGLRRGEAVNLNLDSLDELQETITVAGKGDVVRDVPLAPGVRRAVAAWLRIRGTGSGPLLAPMSATHPRVPVIGRRLSTNSVARVVAHRCGTDVRPHDLRRTFAGDLLDAGADLSIVSAVMGHASPATTAGYDRRGFTVRRAAVDRLNVPFTS